ncbi:flagellin domain-containing protein [Yersinia pseudotuberculosis]|nr:flagellin domain-containing protein [Yersinia pseudotuberculosis]
MIEKLADSVTKAPKPLVANDKGTPEEIELDRLNKLTKAADGEKKAIDALNLDKISLGTKVAANIVIPDYTGADGKKVTGYTIAKDHIIAPADIAKMNNVVAGVTAVHSAAAQAEKIYTAKNSGGVMTMQLTDKDLAMAADSKLSDVIDAYGAFRATLGANQNRLQSSSNNLDNMISNTAQALGSIKDTDFADEMKNHAQSEMLMQSSVMMLKKANAATQLISTLLQG